MNCVAARHPGHAGESGHSPCFRRSCGPLAPRSCRPDFSSPSTARPRRVSAAREPARAAPVADDPAQLLEPADSVLPVRRRGRPKKTPSSTPTPSPVPPSPAAATGHTTPAPVESNSLDAVADVAVAFIPTQAKKRGRPRKSVSTQLSDPPASQPSPPPSGLFSDADSEHGEANVSVAIPTVRKRGRPRKSANANPSLQPPSQPTVPEDSTAVIPADAVNICQASPLANPISDGIPGHTDSGSGTNGPRRGRGTRRKSANMDSTPVTIPADPAPQQPASTLESYDSVAAAGESMADQVLSRSGMSEVTTTNTVDLDGTGPSTNAAAVSVGEPPPSTCDPQPPAQPHNPLPVSAISTPTSVADAGMAIDSPISSQAGAGSTGSGPSAGVRAAAATQEEAAPGRPGQLGVDGDNSRALGCTDDPHSLPVPAAAGTGQQPAAVAVQDDSSQSPPPPPMTQQPPLQPLPMTQQPASAPSHPSAKRLALSIKHSSSLGDLQQLVLRQHTHMDPVHMTACLHRCAVLWAQLATLTARPTAPTLLHSANSTARETVPARAVPAQGDEAAGGTRSSTTAAVPSNLGSLKVRDLELRTPALATTNEGRSVPGKQPSMTQQRSLAVQVSGHLLHMLATNLQGLRWRELSSVLWALATLQLQPDKNSGFLPQLLGHMEALGFSQADTQALANTWWALAQLKLRPDTQWTQAMVKVSVDSIGSMESQHLSVTVWAMGALGVTVPSDCRRKLLEQVHDAMPSRKELRFMLSARTYTPRPGPQHPRMSVMQQYANTLYGLIRLGLAPPSLTWLERFWENTRTLLVLAAPRAGGAAPLVPLPARRQQGQAGASAPGYVPGPPGSRAPVQRPLLPRHCVQLVWSVAHLKDVFPPRVWVRALELQLQQQVAHMSAQELATVCWAYGRLSCHSAPDPVRPWYPPPGELLRDLVLWAHRRRAAATPQGLSMLLWGLARLKLRYAAEVGSLQRRGLQPRHPLTLPPGLNARWLQEVTQAAFASSARESTVASTNAAALPKRSIQAVTGVENGMDQQPYPVRSSDVGLEVPSDTHTAPRSVAVSATQQPPASTRVLEVTRAQAHDASSGAAPKNAGRRTRLREQMAVGSKRRLHLRRSAPVDTRTGTGRNSLGRSPRRDKLSLHRHSRTAQAVANILWSAQVLGIDPGQRCMQLLLGVVKALPARYTHSRSGAVLRIQRACDALGYAAPLS